MKATLVTAEMAEQPDVIARIAVRADAVRDAVREVLPERLTGVTWVARGSSDNAAVLGRYLAEISSGRPSGLAAPSLITRYDAALDYSGQLVVGLSQSGETPEIVDVCRRLKAAGARVIAITNGLQSSLTAVADAVLLTDAGDERAVPATKTVTAQMLLVAVLASAIGSLRIDARDLTLLREVVAAQLAHPQEADSLAAEWREHPGLLVVARGFSYAAALESALKVREVASVHAEGLSVPDLLHGPIAASNPDLPVLLLGGSARTDEDIEEASERLRDFDVPQHRFDAVAGLPEALQPIAATVFGQQLARAWALARDLDPDAPLGLSKVTLTH
jgi:glutamine---fructose-6-phosphate transaminase (isomerizing)